MALPSDLYGQNAYLNQFGQLGAAQQAFENARRGMAGVASPRVPEPEKPTENKNLLLLEDTE